jgi:hypothetical protein
MMRLFLCRRKMEMSPGAQSRNDTRHSGGPHSAVVAARTSRDGRALLSALATGGEPANQRAFFEAEFLCLKPKAQDAGAGAASAG